MTIEKKIQLIAEVLDLEPDQITLDTELAELDEWDSLAALSLIVMADEEFGKKLSGETIRTFKTVQDIIDYVG